MEVIEHKPSCKVIYRPHPIFATRDTQTIDCEIDSGQSVRELLLKAGIDQKQPIVVCLDDRVLEVSEWDLVSPKAGQIVNVKAAASGGGGGGSNPIQTVAMVALMVAVTYFTAGAGTAAFATLTGLEVGGFGMLAAGAGMMLAGSMVINAVFASNPPSAQMGAISGQYSQGSPTYSLSGGSNRMRPYESMPVIFGQIQFLPDLASRPYTEYQGSDQYLYQIFHFGLSDAEFSDFRIGTTSIEDFTDVTWKLPDSNGKIAGFPGNVDSIQGSDLTNAAGWITRTTSQNTYRIGIDVESVLYYSNNSGGMDATSVKVRVQYKKTSESSWQNANILSNTPGISIQADGFTVTGSSQTPIRATLFIDAPTDEYDVRLIRDTADSSDARLQNKTSWGTLRSYQADDATYKGQHRRGLIIKATSQLNGAVQQLSCKATAKATYWNGSAWVTNATRIAAHWFMHFAVGKRDENGRLIYGAGKKASELDLDGLHAWAQFCYTEGLTFDAVLDGQQTVQDLLNAIARCGFGSMTLGTGKLGVVWDARNPTPVGAFGMSNILAGSFEVTYLTENLADEIITRYINPDKDFLQDEVRVLVPGVTNPLRPSTADLFGCANKVMAGKFANYLAAQQKYRTRRIKWDCDFEGFVYQRGDCVILQHDLTQWGYSGRIVSYSDRQIVLDRAVPRNGAIEYLTIKMPDGTMTTYSVEAGSGDSDTLTLASYPQFQDDVMDMDHLWFFSPLPTPGKKVKILSVQPSSESRISLIATDEYAEFYDAWDGTFIEPSQSTLLLSSKPVITSLSVQESLHKKSAGIVSRVVISFSVNGLFDHAKIRYRIEDGSWISYSTNGTSYEFDANQIGLLTVEVLPISNSLIGDPVTKEITLFGLTIPPSDVTGLTSSIRDNGIVVEFDPCPDIDWAYTEIRIGSTWENSSLAVKALSTKYDAGWLPSGSKNYLVRHVDTTGNYSKSTAETALEVMPPLSVIITRSEEQENSVALGWSDSKTSQPISSYSIYVGNDGQSFDQCTLYGKAGADSRSDIVIFRSSGRKIIWMTATDVAGNTSTPSSISITSKLPTNFVLAKEYDIDWSVGEIESGYVDYGSLYLPLKMESWQSHFSGLGASNISDHINLGHELYFEPSAPTGKYTESHDLGKLLAGATISVIPVVSILAGSPSMDILIEWSADNSNWVSSGYGIYQTQASDVRYIRVTYSAQSESGKDLVRIDRINVSISSSTISEFGSLALNPLDVSGTEYICSSNFSDIVSVIATPNNSSNIQKINVIISDSTNPAKVYVQAWDYSNNRTGGTVSINIGGY